MKSQYTLLPTYDQQYEESRQDNYKSVFDYGASNLKSGTIKFTSIYSYSDGFDENLDGSDGNTPAKPSIFWRICTLFVTILCYLGFILTLPFSGWFCFKTVTSYERYVVFRLGHYVATKGPGVILILRCIDRVVKVDLRMKAFSIPPQKVLTNDNAAIEVGADVYYRIADPVKCVSSVQDRDNSIRVLAQTMLQNHLTKKELSDIESSRPILGETLQERINETTKKWGIEVSRVTLSAVKVIQGPAGGESNKAQSLLNMVAPGLLPSTNSHSNMPAGPPPGSASANMFQSMVDGMNKTKPAAGNGQQQFNMLQGLTPGLSPSLMPALDQFAQSGGLQKAMGMMPSMSPTPAAHATVTATPCMETPQDFISAIKPHLNGDLVQEYGLIFKFCVSGSGGEGTYYLDLKNGEGSAGDGDPQEAPDVTFNLTSTVMEQILRGELSALTAYMNSQLTIEGDVQKAMKLGQLVESLRN